MTRTYLMAALALAAATAPAALATSGKAPERPKQERPADHPAKGPKGTHSLLRACVTAEGTPTGVALDVLGGNRHMRRALDGAPTFTAKIDANTVIRLVGRARHLPEGSVPKRLPKLGTPTDLDIGDRLTVRFRAPRGTASADSLPPAFRIVDHGPSKKCAPPADPKPPTTGEQPGL